MIESRITVKIKTKFTSRGWIYGVRTLPGQDSGCGKFALL